MSQSFFDASLGAVVFAAGQGTRMHSPRPKVLQRILDEPMLNYVLMALEPVFADRVWTVIGHGADEVKKASAGRDMKFIMQAERLGTGHALMTAWPYLLAAGLEHVLVVNGDTPLIEADFLRDFTRKSLDGGCDLAFASLKLANPGSFGRVLRQDGRVAGIVEAKDYDQARHGAGVKEVNAGIYCLKLASIAPLLDKLTRSNKSGEYYITDLVELGVAGALKVEGVLYDGQGETGRRLLGINSPRELVESEEFLRARIVDKWLDAGVMIHAPAGMRIGPMVELFGGVELSGPGELYGRTRIEAGAAVGSHCYIKDARVCSGAKVHSFCHIEDAEVGPDCRVGPSARLRPGSVMEQGSQIGNYVEMKKTRLGQGAKANHLAYLGDAEIGREANIGAGTITCNYDGKNKFRTKIGDRAFIGSNSSLVAPLDIGEGSLVGAGSVITEDVPPGALAIGRGRQCNKTRKK